MSLISSQYHPSFSLLCVVRKWGDIDSLKSWCSQEGVEVQTENYHATVGFKELIRVRRTCRKVALIVCGIVIVVYIYYFI